MRFAIFGAGAIGAVLGARLSESGQEVVLIARGAHLAAIRERGLLVRSQVFGEMRCHAQATADPAEAGPADVILLTIKAHQIHEIAKTIHPLLKEKTAIVTFQNGLPWWYFHGAGGRWEDARLESLDPQGVIAEHIDPKRVVGGLAYCSASLAEPGVVDHLEGSRFPLGEPDGSRSERIQRIAKIFSRAGLKAPIRSDIRHEIWVKLMGNAAFNPVSALTRSTLGEMLSFPPTRQLAASIMEEVRAVAAAAGVEISFSIERRIAGAQQIGGHKTSMLQDLEANRPPELEPLVGAVIELADKTQTGVPNLRAVYACTKLLFQLQTARPGAKPPSTAGDSPD